MVWHSDIGNGATQLGDHAGVVRRGDLTHAIRTFGVHAINRSSPVRTTPAIGPGTKFTSPSVGRAMGRVTARATRRIRSASPPAHAGSVSARSWGSASALTG